MYCSRTKSTGREGAWEWGRTIADNAALVRKSSTRNRSRNVSFFSGRRGARSVAGPLLHQGLGFLASLAIGHGRRKG